jgi:hypothetical protein
VRIQRNRFRSARHRMIVIAAANRLQQDRAPATFDHNVERHLAGSAFANLPAPAKSPSPSKSIVASMSPTTQRFDHSPFRRRKSMSFMRPRNIKVIVFLGILAVAEDRRLRSPAPGVPGFQQVRRE